MWCLGRIPTDCPLASECNNVLRLSVTLMIKMEIRWLIVDNGQYSDKIINFPLRRQRELLPDYNKVLLHWSQIALDLVILTQ